MERFGFELELLGLYLLQTVGHSVFDKFEVQTAAWRKILKWLLVLGLTAAIYRWAGHWAIAVIVGLGGMGAVLHTVWCRRNGIDPLRATPRKRYWELRGWEWRE